MRRTPRRTPKKTPRKTPKEDPEEDLDGNLEEDLEEDLEKDLVEERAEFTQEGSFEEEPKDPRVESGELVTKGNEHKDRVSSWKQGRCGRMCRGKCSLNALSSGV